MYHSVFLPITDCQGKGKVVPVLN